MFMIRFAAILLALAAAEPGQPARTLKPDDLDAPAATSVRDAQVAADLAEAMTGGEGHTMTGGEGHAGHGGHAGHAGHAATYTHTDAGREAAPEETATETAEAVYVCPMHPEVTSPAPGTCPKCGMKLVERRKR